MSNLTIVGSLDFTHLSTSTSTPLPNFLDLERVTCVDVERVHPMM